MISYFTVYKIKTCTDVVYANTINQVKNVLFSNFSLVFIDDEPCSDFLRITVAFDTILFSIRL